MANIQTLISSYELLDAVTSRTQLAETLLTDVRVCALSVALVVYRLRGCAADLRLWSKLQAMLLCLSALSTFYLGHRALNQICLEQTVEGQLVVWTDLYVRVRASLMLSWGLHQLVAAFSEERAALTATLYSNALFHFVHMLLLLRASSMQLISNMQLPQLYHVLSLFYCVVQLVQLVAVPALSNSNTHSSISTPHNSSSPPQPASAPRARHDPLALALSALFGGLGLLWLVFPEWAPLQELDYYTSPAAHTPLLFCVLSAGGTALALAAHYLLVSLYTSKFDRFLAMTPTLALQMLLLPLLIAYQRMYSLWSTQLFVGLVLLSVLIELLCAAEILLSQALYKPRAAKPNLATAGCESAAANSSESNRGSKQKR